MVQKKAGISKSTLSICTRAQDILMKMLEEGLALVRVEAMDPGLLGLPKPKGICVIPIPYSITRPKRVRAA